MFFAILPKVSKNIRKSSNFLDFLWEMLLCNCSSGYVKSSFDNPARNFPVKIQVSLVKIQKKDRKTNFSRPFFVTSFLCIFRLLFRHTWLIFYQNHKKLTQSTKKDDTSINYIITFSQSLAEDTWNALLVTLLNIFAKSWILSLREWTRSTNYVSLQKNLQIFRWTRRLPFWQICGNILRQKLNNFAQRGPKSLSNFLSFQRNVPKLSLWRRWT